MGEDVPKSALVAIDPGTKCGWAIWRPGWQFPESGTTEFPLERGASPGMRFVRFRGWLEGLSMLGVRAWVFEQPHLRGGYATDLLVGMTTRIVEEASRTGAEHLAVHTGTLKKWATGSGRADKTRMIDKACKIWGLMPRTEDEADALLLLAYAIERFYPTERAPFEPAKHLRQGRRKWIRDGLSSVQGG